MGSENGKNYIIEEERRLPVSGEYDVVVVGGGIAGVAAALAAARNNARTCLVEKENALGGLATLGLVVIYLPLCDGRGNQVIGGLGEELLKLSLKYGPGDIPPCWKPGGNVNERHLKRYRVKFNPASFMIALEELVLENNITIMYDSRYCDVKMSAGKNDIEAVILENKSGRTAVKADIFIDATGDADMLFDAGEKTVSLDTNVRAGWFFASNGGSNELQALSDPFHRLTSNQMRTFAGDDWREVTEMNIEARKMILDNVSEKEGFPEEYYPFLLPSIPQFRMTRRLSGGFELDDSESHTMYEDAIGLTGDWRNSGPVFSIPYRCLTARKTPNLLAAGRCISVTDSMWDITRAIPTCAVTGEAAGTAAAIAAADHTGVKDIPIKKLREKLKKQGVLFDLPE